EVGEEDLPFAQVAVLGLDRLLDLDEDLGPLPDFGRGAGDLRTRLPVLVVGDAGALAGAALHEHLVPAVDEGLDPAGHQPDAVLVVLDLPNRPYQHGAVLNGLNAEAAEIRRGRRERNGSFIPLFLHVSAFSAFPLRPLR